MTKVRKVHFRASSHRASPAIIAEANEPVVKRSIAAADELELVKHWTAAVQTSASTRLK
jgi:hypothetical protein